MTLLSALLLAGGAYGLYTLLRFVRADCDLTLLRLSWLPAKAFDGKVVWITGASQGLGEVLAKYLASQKAHLLLSARNVARLQRVADECRALGGEVQLLPLDLCGEYSTLEAAAAAADAAFGAAGVDYLVHNAGASQHSLAEETSAEVVEQLFKLNTLGPMHLTRAALPHMLARGKGRIVAVASMSAKIPSPGQAAYAGSKFALFGYLSSVATEVCDRGVSVTLCCPGPIATGSDEAPRNIFGAQGRIIQNATGASNRIAPERCARLIAAAMAHGLDEAWIARHPVLAVGHIFQYLPKLGWRLLKKVGPSRARAVKAGRSGYDVRGIVMSDNKH